jgi:archaemetzincin
MMSRLGIIQVGPGNDCPLEALGESIELVFPWLKVENVTPLKDADEAFDSQRNQYHSTRILALLEKQIRSVPVEKLLGVASFDLFVPGMNFVFGEARLPGRVGIISTHRLWPQSPSDNELFHERVIKEAVHEIGHMSGLRHCADSLCVMHFSEHIGDTDRKHAEFCSSCRPQLEAATR